MLKVLAVLLLGITIGYFIGFSDSKSHADNIVKRLVGRAGGAGRVNNDIDARLEKQIGR